MKILQNHIYCIFPFFFETPYTEETTELWTEEAPKFDADGMYPFMHTGSRNNRVFRLDLDRNPDLRKFFTQTSLLQPGGTPAVNLLSNRTSWLSPRLVISASGEVGVLSIAMSVGGDCEVDSAVVCDFVNRIQKYDSGQAPVFAYRVKGDNTRLQDRLDEALGLCHRQQPHTWTLGTLSELLLRPISGRISMFKPYRTHVLSNILAESPADPDYTLGKDEERLLLRMTHCQNERYHVDTARMADGTVMRTFENIYTGVAVEGACVMRILRHDASDGFLRDYAKGNFQTRYMWMYINALMQRHALLNIDRLLADGATRLDSPDADTSSRFRDSVAGLCAMRLSGVFTSISAYSHINAIYAFFMRNLGVTALYAELDDKLRAVDTWLKLIEARRHASEAQLQAIEAEKRERFEHFVQTGGVILAILALIYGIPQAITALNEAWRDSLWLWASVSLVPAIAGIVWLIVIMKRSRR